MKIKIGLILMAMIFLALSCKKDTSIVLPSPAKTNNTSSTSYLKFKTGNYWVYNVYNHDTINGDVFANRYDSVYVLKDSVINNRTCYYLLNTDSTDNLMPRGWMTDSASFILRIWPGNASTAVLLDPIHLTDTIRTDTRGLGVNTYTVYTIPRAFTNDVVPAGNFSGCSSTNSMRFVSNTLTYNFSDYNVVNYANGIGISCIRYTKYQSDLFTGKAMVWKLLRYQAL